MDNEKVREEKTVFVKDEKGIFLDYTCPVAKFTYEDYVKLDVANDIWNICKISPEHGNAVMDLIGEEAYQRVMCLVKQREEFVNRLVNDFLEEANNGNNNE